MKKYYHKPNGPDLPINTSEFEQIIEEVVDTIGEPGQQETLDYWEGPDTGLDIVVSDGNKVKVEIRIATGWHVDHNGNVVRN